MSEIARSIQTAGLVALALVFVGAVLGSVAVAAAAFAVMAVMLPTAELMIARVKKSGQVASHG